MRHTDWAQDELQERVYRHVLLMLIEFQLADGTTYPCHGTGFLAKVFDQYVMITAGHVLRQIEDNLKAGYPIIRSSFLDFGHSNKPPVRFVYEDAFRTYVDVDQGYDAGLVSIPAGIENALIGNGVVPVTLEDSRNVSNSMAHAVVAGVPQECCRFNIEDDEIEVVPAMFGLVFQRYEKSAVDDSPRYIFWIDKDQIIVDGYPVADIAGISGGPVLGAWPAGDGYVWLFPIGIQVAWHKPSQECVVIPIKSFYALLERVRERLHKEFAQPAADGHT